MVFFVATVVVRWRCLAGVELLFGPSFSFFFIGTSGACEVEDRMDM